MSLKRKAVIGFFGLLACCVIIYLAGPRITVDSTTRPVSLPENIDGYLKAKEGRYPDIVPGAEKLIVWNDAQEKKPTAYAVVYLPGYSATRQETAPLTELVARAIGANVFLARLAGHGRGADAMGEAETHDWLNDGVEAVEIGHRIGEKVILIGSSTGATLAIWLAMQTRSSR